MWADKIQVFWETLQKPYFRELVIDGFFNTIKIAVIGLMIGILIGTLIAVVRVAPKYNLIVRIMDKICTVYVALFRGMPMAVQLLLAYYVILPTMEVNIPALRVAYIVFGMNSGAYVSEIMRGGINSVDVGQMEAGRAVGFGFSATMLKIVVPQAIKNILPTLGNEFITLIKETSIVSFITVYDLYTALVSGVGAFTYERMVPYLALALIYIVLVLGITLLVHVLERAFAKSDRYSPVKRKRKEK